MTNRFDELAREIMDKYHLVSYSSSTEAYGQIAIAQAIRQAVAEERERWLSMDQDDFERATCNQEGEPGHFSCGWCQEHDSPRFQCGCLCDRDKAKIEAVIRNRE